MKWAEPKNVRRVRTYDSKGNFCGVRKLIGSEHGGYIFFTSGGPYWTNAYDLRRKHEVPQETRSS